MKEKPDKKSQLTPSVDELIRHQNVLMERIEKKVDTIGEGHIGLDRKIDKTNEKLDEIGAELQIIKSKVVEHGTKLSEHDRRFDRVESAIIENSKDMQSLKATTKRTEEKLDTVTTDHEHRIQKLEAVR